MDKRKEFEGIVYGTIKRIGITDLMKWIERTDFYEAPASTRYHECYREGLLEHSLNVYYELRRLIKCFNLDNVYNEETIAIVSLFHDVCKIDCYKESFKWAKDDKNQWIKQPIYIWNENLKFGGHGSKSVYLLQEYMHLSLEEAISINCHMGVESLQNIGPINDAFRNCPLAFLLYVADMASTINFQFKKEE